MKSNRIDRLLDRVYTCDNLIKEYGILEILLEKIPMNLSPIQDYVVLIHLKQGILQERIYDMKFTNQIKGFIEGDDNKFIYTYLSSKLNNIKWCIFRGF